MRRASRPGQRPRARSQGPEISKPLIKEALDVVLTAGRRAADLGAGDALHTEFSELGELRIWLECCASHDELEGLGSFMVSLR